MLRNMNLWGKMVLLLVSVPGVSQAVCSPGPHTTGAAGTSVPPQLITTVHGISEYCLANGLDVLLYPDSSEAQVTVNVTYQVGSRHESYGETGMAHLLEHLMFKGTPSHLNIPQEESQHSAGYNAETNLDTTKYFETMPSTKENLHWALTLEADRMVHSLIAKRDLDTEMTVVRNEFESGENNPMSILRERVFEAAYLWHNYSHPTIGARSDIENVPIERLQAFYHTYYQPDNATLIVSGQFETASVLPQIEQLFGKIARPERTLPQRYTEEPVQDGEREVELRRVGSIKVVTAAYHVPAAAHPDTVALELLSKVLAGGSSSRMYKRLVTAKLAIGEEANIYEQHDPGLVIFTAGTSEGGNLDALRAELLKTIEGVKQEPITKQELDRSRDQDMTAFDRSFDSSQNVSQMLSSSVGQGDWRMMFWERDQEKKLSVDDLQRVALHYLIPSNLTLGILIPESKPVRATIPANVDLRSSLQSYDGEPGPVKSEAFDPTPKNIDAHTVHTSAGPLKLDVLRKKTKGDLVTVNIHLHFGDEVSLRGKGPVGDFTVNLLGRGSAKYTRAQLEDEMTKTKTTLFIGGGAAGIVINLTAPKENLSHALEFVAEVVQEPTFDVDQFDEMKQDALSSSDEIKTNPQGLASLELQRRLAVYPKDHLYYIPTPEESRERVRAVTLADVKAFYKQFIGASHGEAAVVGDVDPEVVSKEITRLFGGWKSSPEYHRIPHSYTAVEAKDITFNIADKQNAVFMAGTSVPMGEDNVDFAALMMGDYLFGGRSMDSRLLTRIRQKEGLSYFVSSSLFVEPLDPTGTFTVSAISAPQNEPKVAKAFKEELELARTGNPSTEEIAAAKREILESRKQSLTSDGALSHFLVAHLSQGRDYHWEERLDEKILAVTPEQVQAAMRRYLDPEHMITVAAGDLAKSTAGSSGR